jgi:hypothetical protein
MFGTPEEQILQSTGIVGAVAKRVKREIDGRKLG